MLGFDIGVSALDTSQQALNIIGENLANANTPGYHRQVADLTEKPPVFFGGQLFGTGVNLAQVRQLRNSLVENAITANTSDSANTTAQLDTLNQLQAALGQGNGSLQADLDGFFNQVQQLAASPEDPTLRRVVVSSATTLTGEFNSLANSFSSLQTGLDQQAQSIVKNINDTAQQIAQLNGQIEQATSQGISPNDQLDQRNQLINQLAGLVNVQVTPQDFGVVSVVAGGAALVIGDQANPVQYSVNANNQAVLTEPGSTTPLPVSGGQLGGLLTLRNQTLPGYKARLDALAGQLIQQVDNVQATGLGLSGPPTFLSSTRAVRSTNVPLAQAGLAFPPQAGTLYVSVTNQATGERTLTAVSIDPATQSLQDVANALSAVPNIQAVTNPQTGTLQVLAAPGFAFDFAGRVQPTPSAAGISGTTRPTVGGAYTGSNNDVYTFQVSGSGTIGVTPGLSLQVKDSSGATLTTLNVGQGYTSGSSLQVANGITVQLAAGTANNGDSFTSQVVAQPDTGGLLTALGLGTFFQGSTADDITVQPALVNAPTALAGSRSGDPGDSSNLTRLVSLRDQATLSGGTQTFDQAYASLAGDVGARVSDLTDLQTSQKALGQQLQAQQQSVSGVDPNEELVNLLNFQRAFQIGSEYISVVSSTLNDFLQTLSSSGVL